MLEKITNSNVINNIINVEIIALLSISSLKYSKKKNSIKNLVITKYKLNTFQKYLNKVTRVLWYPKNQADLVGLFGYFRYLEMGIFSQFHMAFARCLARFETILQWINNF